MATVGVETSSELSAAFAKGGTIEIKPGNYILKSATISKSDTELVSTSETQKPLILMQAKHPGGPMISGYNVDGVKFENIILDGNFANQPGEVRGQSDLVLCWLRNSDNIVMRNCAMRNSASDGLKMTSCDGAKIIDNIGYDLGHEFVYAMYESDGGIFRGNNVKTRCNSGGRWSYGASDWEILENTIWSEIESWSTGPGFEFDKRMFSDIDIHDNTFKTLNGSGIWFCADVAGSSNVKVHDNTFDYVGRYYNNSLKYNGYSNAGIAGSGFNGLDIYDNIFKNLMYCIEMSESKHALSSNYTWKFRNNKVSNCRYGFRIDQARGYITGSKNTIGDVGMLYYGQVSHINLSDSSEPDEPVDPVPNTDTKEVIQAIINVENSEGKTGTQTLNIGTSQEAERANGLALITCKMSLDGRSGSKNIEFPCNANAPETIQATTCTGTDLLVSVKLTRTNGQSGLVKFLLPTTEGTGLNQLKLRTADGRYGEGNLSIVLVDPTPEPEPNVEPEVVTANITLENAQGWKGSQTLSIETKQEDVRKYPTTLITTKVTTGGVYGNRNVEFMVDATHPETIVDSACTGNNLLATVELIRPSGDSGKVQFSIPTVTGTGYNIFKFRTPDGRYGESPIDIVLVAPIEPEQTEVKKVTHTNIMTVGGVEIINAVSTTDTTTSIEVLDGAEAIVTTKIVTDTGLSGEYSGTIILRKE